MSTVRENAEQALKLHKVRRAGDITVRSQALQELQEALELPVPLLRIECYDISHVQGTNVVASMVVVEDGLPKKADYRKFSITGAAASDDTAAMHDVLTRRFRHYLQDKSAQLPRAEKFRIPEQGNRRRRRMLPSRVPRRDSPIRPTSSSSTAGNPK
ncbi:uvrABC system protein C [Arthrobacter sp. Hiyo8]|nr:uvrABC system protein C [Arthrobacter sp. Hiyo8]